MIAKDRRLMERYSDPLAHLRRTEKYAGLLAKAEPIAQRMESEVEKDGVARFQMGREWSLLGTICFKLEQDARAGRTLRGMPIYEHALEMLTKMYPHSVGYLHAWHSGMLVANKD